METKIQRNDDGTVLIGNKGCSMYIDLGYFTDALYQNIEDTLKLIRKELGLPIYLKGVVK